MTQWLSALISKPEVDPRDPHSGRKEPTIPSFSPTYVQCGTWIYVQERTGARAHTHTYNEEFIKADKFCFRIISDFFNLIFFILKNIISRWLYSS